MQVHGDQGGANVLPKRSRRSGSGVECPVRPQDPEDTFSIYTPIGEDSLLATRSSFLRWSRAVWLT